VGLFKDSLKLVNEVLTLGGASRLRAAKSAYEETYSRFQMLNAQANSYRTRIDVAVAATGSALTHAKPYLETAEQLIQTRMKDRVNRSLDVTAQTLHKVERFNSGMSSAISVGVGSIAGGTMAVGAWSMVTLFGSASTGAAISGLSGVAATNATLAWFGGGALAAGGAGMAGGMTVLGGIVAIPLVYVAAKSSHKKAKELEGAQLEVEEDIATMKQHLETLPSILAMVEARRRETERLCKGVIAEIVELKKVIRPLGLLSIAKQKILAFIGKNPYSKAQTDAVSELTRALETFLAAFDAQASGAVLRPPEALL